MKRICALAVVSVAFSAAPALGQSHETWSVRVIHADLNLNTEAGKQRLDRRIRHAVRSGCGDAAVLDIRAKGHVRRCREQARAAALAKRDVVLAAVREEPGIVLASSK